MVTESLLKKKKKKCLDHEGHLKQMYHNKPAIHEQDYTLSRAFFVLHGMNKLESRILSLLEKLTNVSSGSCQSCWLTPTDLHFQFLDSSCLLVYFSTLICIHKIIYSFITRYIFYQGPARCNVEISNDVGSQQFSH